MSELSAPLRKMLEAIDKLQRETGLNPTIREVADACGYASVSGPDYPLRQLEEMGAVTRRKGTARSLKITPKGRKLLKD